MTAQTIADQQTTPGALYLVPAPLDFGCSTPAPLSHMLTAHTLEVASTLSVWICENAKSTRAYLKRISESHPLSEPLQSMQMLELPREVHKKGDHNGGFDARYLLEAALQGKNIGLVSEAGLPAIADPGSSVVRAAHDMGLQVRPLAGPVSLMLALAASGLNGQHFTFTGYLPSTPQERATRIKEIESLALKTGQTQLFIETPYRNTAMLQSLLQVLQANTRLATAAGLTLEHAVCHSATTKVWKTSGWTMSNDVPAVFAIGR
jgi:16S rRNA (cytidine1402-2'-O)-methyltransferase